MTSVFYQKTFSVAKKPTYKCGQPQAQNIHTENQMGMIPSSGSGCNFFLGSTRLLLEFTEENSPIERNKLYFQEIKVFAQVTYFTHTIML